MEKIHGILMAITIGLCLGLQPAINSSLGKSLTPKVAAFHSILVTFIVIFLIVLFSNELPIYKNIVNIHPVYWMGGILGFCMVFLAILTIPILGSSASIAIFVTVQLIAGSILDHFGLLGIERSPLMPKQLLGMVVLMIGVKLILK